ncbi:CusA/CzcA family heavy metal efflux RND transporter [Gemmatimonas sp.]|uniref:efflux RND transporter permease subunit n=1 Tax=Gemmatimonas sp. TaxID=1962908 RepID=UPI00286D8D04|nr:CusA/CzcA family heavy metal efflux RND transporter [Gemmatimonas sp.]
MRKHSESPGNESDSPDGVVERIVAWSVQQRLTVLVMVLAVAAAGVWALRTLRVDAFPDLTDAQVQVLIEAPGLSPVEVERLTTFPIEVAMNGLPDVTLVRSVSKYGFAAVTVVFEDGVDIQRARTLVSERLQSVREALPTGADATLGPLSAANSEIYMYTVEHADAGKAGDTLDMRALRTLQDRVVRPQLRTVSGVTEVNSFGGEVRQAQVVVRPERLVSFGLTLHDVVEAVESNNAVAAGGYLEHRDEQYILRGLGAAATLDDLRNTVIRASSAGVPVLIGDVADVRYGAELRQGAVSHDGRGEVVSGIVMMLRGENGREVVERVRARVEDINRSLPPGVKVIPYYDQTDLVAGTLRTVRTNLVEGGLLVIAVLLLFLGNVRAALLVAVTIPLSLLCAFLGMRWLGLSANLMSLGAIDFGMIVDGSVVMTEHFVRTLHGDEEAGKLPSTREGMAARLVSAAREVARPIAFGVLIIMLVYVPILSLQGLEARMFRPMAITVAIALFGSLLLALCFIPAASTWVFQRGARESKIAQRMERVLDARYARALAVVAKRPMATVLTALSILVATLFVVPRLGTEFLPQLDEGSLLIAATKDPTISLSRSVAMQDALERTVRQSPEVTTVVSRVGRAEIGSDPMGVNQADVFVMLKPRDQWRPGLTKDSLEREITERLEEGVPGIAIGMTQPMQMRLDELISGVRADLAIKIFGDDPIVTRAVAEQVAGVVRSVPGADEVQIEQTAGQGYLNVRLDRAAMARFGIPMAEVQEALETAVGGRPVSQLVEGSYAVDVAVYYPEALRTSPEAIGAITVPAPVGGASGGARIALSQIADIRLENGPVQVSRERAQRYTLVQSNVAGRDLGGFATDVRRAVEAGVKVPPAVFVTYGGAFENQQRAMARLQVVVPLSIFLIALLLWASLRSWWLAGLVLVNLPFAAVGGVLALWSRGLHLSVSASIGFIALFGVAVLNGLVLLTTVQRARARGASPSDAAIGGARERLRPVLMTALVASLGFVPVALSHGTGAEVQRPLATVVIGGLVTSTLLTLLVLPTLYAWIEGWRSRRAARDADRALDPNLAFSGRAT